jgi:hypothetical protein
MDRITESLLNEFVEQNELNNCPQDKAFELFSGFLVTSGHYTETFDIEEIHVGAGNDCGIDTIAIIINGCFVTEVEEIEDLVETNGFLDATFIFNQAERSSSFDTAKVGQFGFGVNDFFSSTPALPQNLEIKKKWNIVNEILSRSSKFRKGNPQCFLYYSTTGKWVKDQNLTVRKDSVIADLNSLGIFRKVEFEFIDAERIQTMFRESKNAISTEINFSERIVLPELRGIEQAYLGLLSATEYLKLIKNTNDEIISSIFYDNVRHWQDWNPVNTEIKQTLDNDEQNKHFPLLNNGVTIIAKRIIPTGNRFVIEDYQIVNGCQTSYVIYECQENLNSDILIPLRLISTQDSYIRNSIIKATNRQTQVPEEQLSALADFPKQLESYFPTFEGAKKLYYERRSRQYNSEENVEKVRVITMTALIRAYSSMYLGYPHRTTRNYKALLKSIGSEIFAKEHRLEMYYVAAFAHYKLEYLFRSGVISPNLKPARYHILYAFRVIANNTTLPRPNSNEMKRYCESIMAILWDDNAMRTNFIEAARIISDLAGEDLHSDTIRTESFTEKVKQAFPLQDS